MWIFCDWNEKVEEIENVLTSHPHQWKYLLYCQGPGMVEYWFLHVESCHTLYGWYIHV